MKKIDNQSKKEIYGGIAATAVFTIISLVMTGISLISGIATGAMNIANSSKKKDKNQTSTQEPIEFNKSFDSLSYANII